MWDLQTQSLKPDKAAPHKHVGRQIVLTPEGALPAPYPYSPFVHRAEGRGKARPAFLDVSGCSGQTTSCFMKEGLVRQGTELMTYTLMHPYGSLFMFSSLGEQNFLPASSIHTYWSSQKGRVYDLKKKKRETFLPSDSGQ